jgi:hypothetical protein
MDTIFHKTKSIFSVVRVAKEEPHRYGKKGEILINYEDTAEHREHERRRSSIAADLGRFSTSGEKPRRSTVENAHHSDPNYAVENGYDDSKY